jgi:hypothetical protein
LHDLKSDIISEQENLSLKVKEQVNLKFKSEDNKIQFRFNEEIAADLAKLQKHCTSSVNNSLVLEFGLGRVSDLAGAEYLLYGVVRIFPLSLICLMALFSAWRILFSSSEPFVPALHGVSRAPGMCVSTVKVWDIGEKTVRSSTEPARIQLQQHILNEAQGITYPSEIVPNINSLAPISFQYCMCFFKLPLTPLKLPCNLLFSK